MPRLSRKQWRKKLLDATSEVPEARTRKTVAAALFFNIAASLAKSGDIYNATTVLEVGHDLLTLEWAGGEGQGASEGGAGRR